MNATASLRPGEPETNQDRLAGEARLALRRLAATVSVISCHGSGASHAMTATSVSALSMEPPSLLVCVNRSNRFYAALIETRTFAVNMLGRDQAEISRACSGAAQGAERFSVGGWDLSGGAPTLPNAQAVIACERDLTIDYGTHTIFTGRIRSVVLSAAVDPLIYLDGAYARRPLEGLATADPDDAWYLL
jgi:flavin reductase (DIM6/NTAB) family NADH-FMN oxidoreductase RutF